MYVLQLYMYVTICMYADLLIIYHARSPLQHHHHRRRRQHIQGWTTAPSWQALSPPSWTCRHSSTPPRPTSSRFCSPALQAPAAPVCFPRSPRKPAARLTSQAQPPKSSRRSAALLVAPRASAPPSRFLQILSLAALIWRTRSCSSRLQS